MELHKDEVLAKLAETGNVAQFVAYRPGPAGTLAQSTSRVSGCIPNAQFESVREAVVALLAASGEGAVNVRTYLPDDPRGHEFVYRIRSVDDAVSHLERLRAQGLHLILNETVDHRDGGVSGVAEGDVIEFAPDDTTRAVERSGTASLPRALGLRMLEAVYGFAPDLPSDPEVRVEFSIHPMPRGCHSTNTLLWEIEEAVGNWSPPKPFWPNNFSRHIGDKTFGLIMADLLGAKVPRTTVIGRRVSPFSFGVPTGSTAVWMRTAPREQEPGLFTTIKGWRDPFAMLADEDPTGRVASILAQAAVSARYSGAAIVGAGDRLIIEGKAGEGDSLMLGIALPEVLPPKVLADVVTAHAQLTALLGPVRIEWVHDGEAVWVIQLHIGVTETSTFVIVEGEAERWVRFDVTTGLKALRELLDGMPADAGIELSGRVGLTSHIAETLRRARRPARFQVKRQ